MDYILTADEQTAFDGAPSFGGIKIFHQKNSSRLSLDAGQRLGQTAVTRPYCYTVSHAPPPLVTPG